MQDIGKLVYVVINLTSLRCVSWNAGLCMAETQLAVHEALSSAINACRNQANSGKKHALRNTYATTNLNIQPDEISCTELPLIDSGN